MVQKCHGEPWRNELVSHLKQNRDTLVEFIQTRCPALTVRPGDATYLAWIDATELGVENPSQHFEKKDGKGRGIACGFDAGTWVALIVEVQVDKQTGHVQVNRCVCAQDMGLVVNPHGATIQAEGGITMGLGYALSEDVEFEGGNINSRDHIKHGGFSCAIGAD